MMSGSASDSMIDIGAVPAKKLTMTVRSDTTNLHVFSGAYLFSLKMPSGVSGDGEDVLLTTKGIFTLIMAKIQKQK